MKCPHCEYEYRVTYDKGTREQVGDRGDFYELPVKMERDEEFGHATERINLYACPKCWKAFINSYG